eukprot:1885147-Amphidinium_carterae.1
MPIKTRRDPDSYVGLIQSNCRTAEVRSCQQTSTMQGLRTSKDRGRAMLPVPDQVLATLASFHREQARRLFSGI